MNPIQLPDWYREYKDFVETSIDSYFDIYLSTPMSAPLENFKQVIRYSCKWWKKLRAILALEFYLNLSWKSFSDIKKDDDIIKFCIAIEIIHAFSLVHDDLPCMDNDELRRGEATTWKKFSEYEAVLAGDMLNTLGFEILSDIKDPKISQELSKLMSHSIGFYGMVGWQIEDMYFEENISELDEKILKNLHYKKTGKLIEAAICWWIILSEEKGNIEIFKDFGRKLGLAFQIKDDLLDVEWTPEETWKSVWWEEKGFVYLSGVDATRRALSNMITQCKQISQKLQSEKISFIVEFVENRTK